MTPSSQKKHQLYLHYQEDNHRMVGVGRDLCGSSSPTPLLKQGHPERLHRTASRQVLNISREGDSTTSLGSLFQGSVTLRRKKFFLMFRRNFLCFSLCPLPLVLSLNMVHMDWAGVQCSWPLCSHPQFQTTLFRGIQGLQAASVSQDSWIHT